MTPIEQQRRRYYQTTPYVNYNPAAQDLKNLLGNFFMPNATPYQNPQYQRLPTYGGQAMIPVEARQDAAQYLLPIGAGVTAAGIYAANQMTQNGLMRAGTGATPGTVASMAAYPAAMWAASKIGQPAVNAVNRVANSPVGKWGAKLIDWAF